MAEQLTLRWNEDAKNQARTAAFNAIKEVMVFDVKPKAQELSPVTEEGMARNIEKHPTWNLTKAGGTGTNRRSIDVEVREDKRGVIAELFTTSGYGGWLEIGTRFMRAQPYLWPALKAFVNKFAPEVKARIGNR